MNKFLLSTLAALSVLYINALCPSYARNEVPLNMSHFLQNITLTETGLSHFYTCYNHQFYVRRFLPSCFLHVDDLLTYAKSMEEPHTYVQKIFSLFHERFKACTSDNPYALAQLLTLIPERIAFLFDPDERRLEGKDLYQLIRSKVEDHLTHLDTNPSGFTNELATDLYAIVQTDRSRHATSFIITRFLEGALDKLIWSPDDKFDVWKSFKTIGTQLEVLHGNAIIQNPDALNHLLWSLVYRFCYFFELWGSAISIDSYDKMLAQAPTIHFLQLLEQEEHITTKLETLIRALRTGKMKAIAYKRGILT